jgi:hypothetical protein
MLAFKGDAKVRYCTGERSESRQTRNVVKASILNFIVWQGVVPGNRGIAGREPAVTAEAREVLIEETTSPLGSRNRLFSLAQRQEEATLILFRAPS